MHLDWKVLESCNGLSPEISSRHGLELLGQNRIHSNLPGLEFSLALNQLQVEGQDSVGRDSYLISNLAKLFLFFRTMPQRSHIQIFSNTQKDFCNRLHGIFFPSFLSLSSQMNLRFIIPVSSGWWIDAEQWEKIHRQLVPGGNLYSLLKLKVNPFSNNNKKKKILCAQYFIHPRKQLMRGPLENGTNVILSKLCSVVYGDNVISRADGLSKRKEAGRVGGKRTE